MTDQQIVQKILEILQQNEQEKAPLVKEWEAQTRKLFRDKRRTNYTKIMRKRRMIDEYYERIMTEKDMCALYEISYQLGAHTDYPNRPGIEGINAIRLAYELEEKEGGEDE